MLSIQVWGNFILFRFLIYFRKFPNLNLSMYTYSSVCTVTQWMFRLLNRFKYSNIQTAMEFQNFVLSPAKSK